MNKIQWCSCLPCSLFILFLEQIMRYIKVSVELDIINQFYSYPVEKKKFMVSFSKYFCEVPEHLLLPPWLDHCAMFKYKPPMENGMKLSGKRCHSFYPRKFPLEVLFVQKTFQWTIFPAESSRYLVLFLHYLQQWGGTMQLLLITALKIWRTASPRALSNKHNRTNSCKST